MSHRLYYFVYKDKMGCYLMKNMYAENLEMILGTVENGLQRLIWLSGNPLKSIDIGNTTLLQTVTVKTYDEFEKIHDIIKRYYKMPFKYKLNYNAREEHIWKIELREMMSGN